MRGFLLTAGSESLLRLRALFSALVELWGKLLLIISAASFNK